MMREAVYGQFGDDAVQPRVIALDMEGEAAARRHGEEAKGVGPATVADQLTVLAAGILVLGLSRKCGEATSSGKALSARDSAMAGRNSPDYLKRPTWIFEALCPAMYLSPFPTKGRSASMQNASGGARRAALGGHLARPQPEITSARLTAATATRPEQAVGGWLKSGLFLPRRLR